VSTGFVIEREMTNPSVMSKQVVRNPSVKPIVVDLPFDVSASWLPLLAAATKRLSLASLH
jgi:hypothetical protein